MCLKEPAPVFLPRDAVLPASDFRSVRKDPYFVRCPGTPSTTGSGDFRSNATPLFPCSPLPQDVRTFFPAGHPAPDAGNLDGEDLIWAHSPLPRPFRARQDELANPVYQAHDLRPSCPIPNPEQDLLRQSSCMARFTARRRRGLCRCTGSDSASSSSSRTARRLSISTIREKAIAE